MRRSVFALSVLGVLVVAGCGGDSLIDLATYKPTSLELVFDKSTANPLGIGLMGTDQVSSDGCPVIDGSVKAKVDGLVLSRSGSGGTALGAETVDPTTCGPTEWIFPKQVADSVKTKATNQITIGPNNEITVEVANLFTERKLQVLDPADGNLVAGQTVTLGWVPISDKIDTGKLVLTIQPTGGSAVTLQPTLDGAEDTLTFTVPHGISGAARINASGEFVAPKFVSCSGVPTCSGSLEVESALPVTVQ